MGAGVGVGVGLSVGDGAGGVGLGVGLGVSVRDGSSEGFSVSMIGGIDVCGIEMVGAGFRLGKGVSAGC